MKYRIIGLFLLCWAFMSAQPPVSNLYLFEYTITPSGAIFLNNPTLLTKNNLHGYNNQPAFFSSDDLFFTRQYSTEDQTDIVQLDLRNEKEIAFTETRQSEYSPTLMQDGEHVSCIRVEDDGTQVLWKYPLDKSHAGKRILPHIKDIGYHFWLDDSEVLLFIVGADNTLVHANTKNDDVKTISSKIGRCFGRLPDGRLLFVYKYTESIWHIKVYDPITQRSRFLAETIAGSEDFAITDDGNLIMGKGSKIYLMGSDYLRWNEIGDLSIYGIQGITRLAFKDDELVVVAQ